MNREEQVSIWVNKDRFWLRDGWVARVFGPADYGQTLNYWIVNGYRIYKENR